MHGWTTFCSPTDVHVMPVDDLREHDTSEKCWCNPRRDEIAANTLIHNSLDRRETTEELKQ